MWLQSAQDAVAASRCSAPIVVDRLAFAVVAAVVVVASVVSEVGRTALIAGLRGIVSVSAAAAAKWTAPHAAPQAELRAG